MNPLEKRILMETRRQFLTRGKNVLGMAALSSLMGDGLVKRALADDEHPAPHLPNFPAKAKNIIYLHMVGGPSQMDLFDYKPKMAEMYDKICRIPSATVSA